MEIGDPSLEWRGGAPFSKTFDDVYYSGEPAEGLAETRHVFLNANNLSERFSKLKPGQNFVIAELGFGTALNFIASSLLFNTQAPLAAALSYLSVEKYPLKKGDLEKALSPFCDDPAFRELADEVIEKYPLRLPGFHKVVLANGRVNLNLALGDAAWFFDELREGPLVDAWFLDGFMPPKNPNLWSPALFRQMRGHSKTTATLSTYTAAGHVRRGLEEAGFVVQKIGGFGKKREMITANLDPSFAAPSLGATKGEGAPLTPWLNDPPAICVGDPEGEPAPQHRAAIIGGGLAGCALAEALARRGIPSVIYEKKEGLAMAASGNPRGIFSPFIHKGRSHASALSHSAYTYLLAHLRRLRRHGLDVSLHQSGLLQRPGNNEDEGESQAPWENSPQASGQSFPEDFLLHLDPAQASQAAGIEVGAPARLYPLAGSLSPRALCEANIALAQMYPFGAAASPKEARQNGAAQKKGQESGAPNVEVKTGVEITSAEPTWGGGACKWVLSDSAQNRYEATILILANSAAALELGPRLPLASFRGQLFFLPQSPATQALKMPLNGQAYIIPAEDGRHVVGATYSQDTEEHMRPQENLLIAANLAKTLPAAATLLEDDPALIEACGGRVSFRSAAADHRPLIGALPDPTAYEEIFSHLAHGPLAARRKLAGRPNEELRRAWFPNHYILAGLGSRGILYSQIGAEIVASYITAEPLPIERSIAQSISPARFAARKLRRQKA